MKKNTNKGFTLIETIIYIALFSLLMGVAFSTAFHLIDGSYDLSTKNTIQEEGNFVMRKLSYTLTGIETITTPVSGSSSTLVIKKYDGNQIDVQQNGTKIEIKESTNGNVFLPITTDNVTVKASSLNFSYITPSGTGPAGITASFTITKDGTDFPFTITKYIRK